MDRKDGWGYQIFGKKDDEKRPSLQDHRRALKPISSSSQREFAPHKFTE